MSWARVAEHSVNVMRRLALPVEEREAEVGKVDVRQVYLLVAKEAAAHQEHT